MDGGESGETAINHARAEQLLDTGAATRSPSRALCCLQMLDEGVAAKAPEGGRQVRDLLEILDESLG